MSGHESPQERDLINELEKKCLDKKKASIEDLMKLGQLYIEPAHEEDKAIEIFKEVLYRDPNNAWAKYWLSYCYVHYSMEKKDLMEAKKLLESELEKESEALGAIYALYAEVLQDLEEIALPELIPFLEKSVELEPDWVQNRLYLAFAYEAAGKTREAITEIEQALKNILTRTEKWTIQQYYFEIMVTGRIISDSAIKEYKKKLQQLKQSAS